MNSNGTDAIVKSSKWEGSKLISKFYKEMKMKQRKEHFSKIELKSSSSL